MKKIIFLLLVGLGIYFAYAKIIKPFINADKGKTANLFFGAPSVSIPK
jgi:hypothetical protein